MSIEFTTTKGSAEYVKLLVYGESGVGKTGLIATAPEPLIISSESKLRVLSDLEIPVIKIQTIEDFRAAYDFVVKDEKAKGFKTICLDSISDIAETVLTQLLKDYTDGRQAYGELNSLMTEMVKKFRDLEGKNVYFIAKQKRIGDPASSLGTFSPLMPGQTLGPALPYYFDYVFAMRVGQDEDKNLFRYLQTESDLQYQAKGDKALEKIEEPNLNIVFKKLSGDSNVNSKEEKKNG